MIVRCFMRKIYVLLLLLFLNQVCFAEENWKYLNTTNMGKNYIDLNSIKKYVNSPIVSVKIKTKDNSSDFERSNTELLINCKESKIATSNLTVYERNEYGVRVKWFEKKTNFNIVNPESLWQPFEHNSLGHYIYKNSCY